MRTPPPVLGSSDGAPAYRLTWFDRHGPDAGVRLKAYSYGFMTAVLTTFAIILGVTQGGQLPARVVAGALLAGLITGALSSFGTLAWAAASGKVVSAATWPSGKSTPYEEQFSYQDSLAIRGDVAGALASYEAVIAERPEGVLARLKAAELYATRGGDPARAAELFREARVIPSVSARDALYASTRLVDLYDRDLDQPGRALVELRRIVELYPHTPVARHAREAIPRLKARLIEAESELREPPA